MTLSPQSLKNRWDSAKKAAPKAAKKAVAKKAVAKKAAKPVKAVKALTATAAELAIHPIYGTLPTTHHVLHRLETDAKKAKGGQFEDKQELLDETAENWQAFVADIGDRGIQEPIIVCPVPEHTEGGPIWWVINGRDRYMAGQALELPSYPIRVSQEEPAKVILADVTARKHWTKSQRAYFALSFHPHLIDGVQGKRNDKVEAQPSEKIGKWPDGTFSGGPGQPSEEIGKSEPTKNRETLAASIGVSADTIDLAAKVHTLFAKDPAARKKYEPLIFGGMSLSGVLTGDAASKAEDGLGNKRQTAWDRLKSTWARQAKTLAADWEEVAKQPPTVQAEVKESLTTFLAALPPALCEHAREILNNSPD